MQATDDLRAEHRGVLRMCAILDAVALRVRDRGRLPSAEDVDSIEEFLRVFVDQCHHHKEESLLFPALAAVGPRTEGLISELLAEHQEGRSLVDGLGSAATAATAAESDGGAGWAASAETYTTLLRQHIAKEEERLFPEADSLLAPGEQARLAEEYERVEEDIIGGGRHEAFHALLEDLAGQYGVVR